MREVISCALGGIVCEERVADAHFTKRREKRRSRFEERAALIDRAVHVEGHVFDILELALHFCYDATRLKQMTCFGTKPRQTNVTIKVER